MVVAVVWSGGVLGRVPVWVLSGVLLDQVDADKDVVDGDLLRIYAHCIWSLCASDRDNWVFSNLHIHEDYLRPRKDRLD